MDSLASDVRAGNRRAIARAITVVENSLPEAAALADEVYRAAGRAWRIGITGPPGAGKSTLVDRLVSSYREAGHTVGVVAVDPSSPFTGGALLGDRVRMEDRVGDGGVYFRSLAARGAPGGLAAAAESAADVLDAAGFDIVLIETVGVGQSEVDVAAAADTVVVVLVPESGDAVQAMKAGLVEIADVFCVNKADHPEALLLVRALKQALEMREPRADGWPIPVVHTSATSGDGLDDLVTTLHRHREASVDHVTSRRLARLRRRVMRLVEASQSGEYWTTFRRRALDDAVSRADAAPHDIASRLLAVGEVA
jgi:LAO/AO transport system kinase